MLPHAKYSPYLTPRNDLKFPNVKELLAGRRFAPNEEIIAQKIVYFANVLKLIYTELIKKLEKDRFKEVLIRKINKKLGTLVCMKHCG